MPATNVLQLEQAADEHGRPSAPNAEQRSAKKHSTAPGQKDPGVLKKQLGALRRQIVSLTNARNHANATNELGRIVSRPESEFLLTHLYAVAFILYAERQGWEWDM